MKSYIAQSVQWRGCELDSHGSKKLRSFPQVSLPAWQYNGTWGSFFGVKELGRETYSSLPSGFEVANE
jgi:ABC-type antimicrobial peptide transport system permease subunit